MSARSNEREMFIMHFDFRLAAATVMWSAAVAQAGEPKEPHLDVHVSIVNGKVRTGSIDASDPKNPVITPGARVFGAEFGKIIPDYTDEPGFEGTNLPAGAGIGFNVLAQLGAWNGGGFEPADETITIAVDIGNPGLPSITTGTGFVAGFDFAVADLSGVFHQHLDFLLNAAGEGPAPADGVYLLTLELTSGNTGSLPSRPFWIVFNQNSDEEMHDAAIDWVNEHLVPAPGVGAAAAVIGCAWLKRRRRLAAASGGKGAV